LVALWPLVTYRKAGLTVVRPLGAESSEYSAPLIEPGISSEALLAQLWSAAVGLGDLLLLPYVRQDSCLMATIAENRLGAFIEEAINAPLLARAAYPDWNAYLESVSSSHLAMLRRKQRRLAERGRVEFKRESPETAAALTDWVLSHKKDWIRRRQLSNDWIPRADYRAFLLAMLADPAGLSLFTLKVDGVPVAAQINAVDAKRVEFLIGVHDVDWGRYSPGELLMQDCLHWAYRNGLDYDFRIGEEPYKSTWARSRVKTQTWYIATSWRGAVSVRWMNLHKLVRQTRSRLGLGRFLPRKVRRLLGQHR